MSAFKRKVIILSSAIVVLAGAYVLGLVFSPARVGQRESAAPVLADFDDQQRRSVAEIRLETGEGSVRLVRRGGSWILPEAQREYPADPDRVEALFDFLSGLQRTRVVTENPDTWAEFEVQTDAARSIRLLDSDGNEVQALVVGKSEMGSSRSYVRLAGSSEVLLSGSSFDYYLNVEPRFWSELRIFPADLEGQNIMRISINSTLQLDDELGQQAAGTAEGTRRDAPLRYSLIQNSEQPSVWVLADGADRSLDDAEIDLLAGNIADLEASDFARGIDRRAAGLAEPSARIRISTVDDKDYQLLIGAAAGEDQYYGSLDGGQYIYQISQWRVKNILKDVGEYFSEQEP